ncbi:sensor histidine kinase [Undibacterium sp. Di24W]|uniref:sensor histidine kinase n=1 Tax=Undibacterium sp. Di24W TaxID=3413033 RepID=UPI003BF1F30D
MNLLHLLLRPSLVRRVSMTLLLASLLIWVVLMAYYYWQETGQRATTTRQRERAELVVAVLAKIDDVEQVRNGAKLYSALFNAPYQRAGLPENFLLQLEDRQGQVLFSSAAGGKRLLKGVAGNVIENEFNGERYHVYRAESGAWVLLIGEPVTSPGWLLARLSSNLTMSMIISFPLLLLPIWFAVTRGMRPLKLLSNRIAARGPDDLSPLEFNVEYAELSPLAAALDRLLDQLRTKLSREHGFVQDAAHELRTPLAVISAQAHVMMKAETPEERKQAGTHLDAAITRASHLIKQLLDLARIENDEAHTTERLDLCQLLRQALAETVPIATEGNIDLSLEAPDELTRQIDRNAFLSIVHNLLSNALHYGHEKKLDAEHQRGEVHVELILLNTVVMLSVADDGPGIAEAERALVFERFYRVAGSDKSGSGLGLAIVAQAVARLHGRVRIESGLHGRGCRFIVELPLQ